MADRDRAHRLLPECLVEPAARRIGDFGVEADVEIGRTQPREIGRAGTERRGHVDVDAERAEQAGDFYNVVAVAESQRGRPEQIDARTTAFAGRRAQILVGEFADQLVEGLRRAPIFLALIARQFERHDRDREPHRLGETRGIVLDQLGGAGRADQHRLRLEAFERIARGTLEQFGGVLAEIARLEGGVGDRGTLAAPFNHREQQIGIGVALRRVEHVMHALHRGRDPHCPDMGWSFVGPDGELHRVRPSARRDAAAAARKVRRGHPPGRNRGSARRPVRSPISSSDLRSPADWRGQGRKR